VFALEALHKVVDKLVVKVLTTQMGVTGGGLHLEDTLLDCQEGHIEGPSSKIEDVVLTDNFLVKTVCDGSSSGLVDDTKNVHSGDGAGIGVLHSLSLGVVEVGRDGDGRSSGLVDDTKNIHSGDGAGIGVLRSLSLGVVEVGRDGDGKSSGLVDDMKNVHSRDGAGIGILRSLSLGVVEVGRDGHGRSSGLDDDTKNVHSGDGAGIGILCSLSLGVVEVGRDGNDGVSDVVAQVGLSGLLHLKEDHQRIKNTIKVC